MKEKVRGAVSIASAVKHLIAFLVLPTISLIILYLLFSYFYFMEDALTSQQAHFCEILTRIETLDGEMEQFLHSVQSIRELTYMLDDYSKKSEVLYSLLKTLRPQLNSLVLNNSIVSSVRIFSLKPPLIHVDPLYGIDELPLSEATISALSAKYNYPILWRLVPGDDPKEMPQVYAYRRLYGYEYTQTIGYIETTVSEKTLSALIGEVRSTASFRNGRFSIYQAGKLIYSPDGRSALADESCLANPGQSWQKVLFPSFTYVNCVSIPSLSIQAVISGSVFSLSTGKPLIMLFFLFFVLLTVSLLLIRYYRRMKNLAAQITDFSCFMQNTNPETLLAYSPKQKLRENAGNSVRYEEMESLIASYNHLITRNQHLQKLVREMETLTAETRYQALQAQIHPHFIYGTLENIRMQALQNRDMETNEMIFSLSRLIRRTISITSQAVSLKDEMEVAHDYLKIQQIRMGGRFSYEESVEVDPEKLFLPSFTLQPLLENAIVHGISKTDEPCRLMLSVSGEETIHVRVCNSSSGIDPERLEQVNRLLAGKIPIREFECNGHGRALYNISERLRILYNGRASIRLEQVGDLTCTCITIDREAKIREQG